MEGSSMKIRNDKLPMARHGRVLALLILIALMLTAGACSKNKPASDPRQVADRFMDLYYVQMNMEEARKLSGGEARKKLKAKMGAVKEVKPDKPAGEPAVKVEMTASDKASATEANFTYRVTPQTSDVKPIDVQLSLVGQKERWRVRSFSETKASAK
jgi:hypothetical protein